MTSSEAGGTLGDYLDSLRQTGDLDSGGQFTLDPRLAREKLKQYRLVFPEHFLLQLVSAAVMGGATVIDFRPSYRTLAVSFDGKPFERQDLEVLFQANRGRLYELAVALTTAEAMGPARILFACSVVCGCKPPVTAGCTPSAWKNGARSPGPSEFDASWGR